MGKRNQALFSLFSAIQEQRRRNDAEEKDRLARGRNAIELRQHRERLMATRALLARGSLRKSQLHHLLAEHPEMASATRAERIAKVLAYVDAAIAAIDLKLCGKRPGTRRNNAARKVAEKRIEATKKEIAKPGL